MRGFVAALMLMTVAVPNASAAVIDCTAVAPSACQLARSGADYAIRSTRQRHIIEGQLVSIGATGGTGPLACALSDLAKEWDVLAQSSATETVRGEYQRSAAVARAFMSEHGYEVKP